MNPKAARTETYPHVHREENCPCADTSGTVVATRRVPGFQVVENHYPAGLELTSHRHEHAYLSYVLAGPYAETYGNSTSSVVCAPRVLRYLPPAQTHANVFDEGSHCLIVEVEAEALKRVEEHTKALDRPGEIQGIASTWLAQRLYHEFRQGDGLALVSLEGILLEMLAEGARHTGADRVAVIPRWLHIAREYLEANFLRQVSLAEIAGAAGVHRVHLSREFRRYFSTTVGEFLRRKRIEHACQLVSTTQVPFGFSDQSHFSATFRRQTGLTPARYRQSAR
jgi:AraC family transcriptional regulator